MKCTRFLLLAFAVVVAGNAGTLYLGSSGTVGAYDATTGTAIKADFITDPGNSSPSLALSGNTLFVANFNGGTVGTYDATTGAAINANFITGLAGPLALALSGNTLFVTNFNGGTVGAYDATTGAAINASFITLTSANGSPKTLALSGNSPVVAP